MGFNKANKMVSVYKKLEIGQSKDDIVQKLGKPDGQKLIDGKETYTWTNTEFKGTVRGGSKERRLIIEFQDDKVVGWDGLNMSMSTW